MATSFDRGPFEMGASYTGNDEVTDDNRKFRCIAAIENAVVRPSLDVNNNNWREISASRVPTGGTTGQVLSKKSNDNYDLEWVRALIELGGYPIDVRLLSITGNRNMLATDVNKTNFITSIPNNARITIANVGEIGDSTAYINGTSNTFVFRRGPTVVKVLRPNDSLLIVGGRLNNNLNMIVAGGNTVVTPPAITERHEDVTLSRLNQNIESSYINTYVPVLIDDIDYSFDLTSRTSRRYGVAGDRIIFAEAVDFFPSYFDVKVRHPSDLKDVDIRVTDHRQFEVIKLPGDSGDEWFPNSDITEERAVEFYYRRSRPSFPNEGMTIANSVTNRIETYLGGQWRQLNN